MVVILGVSIFFCMCETQVSGTEDAQNKKTKFSHKNSFTDISINVKLGKYLTSYRSLLCTYADVLKATDSSYDRLVVGITCGNGGQGNCLITFFQCL
jgi:hypothetical protein